MKNKKQNILIIGAGLIGSRRAHIARKFSPKSNIYIYDTNYKRSSNLALEINGTAVNNLDAILKDKSIKYVVVAVINKYAKDICIKALKNGKNVLCEKPLGRNYKEAKEIASAAIRYKRVLKCGFNHRYHPAILEAHKLCKKGTIGKILFIRAIYGHGGRKGYDKEWRASKDLCGGGELLDQGCHLIDLSLWFLNFEEIKKTNSIKKTMFWNMEVEDNAFCLFETKSGKIVQLHASWTQWKNKFVFEIYGDKGSIEINGLGKSYGDETLKISIRKNLGKAPIVKEKVFKGDDLSWELEWKDFIKSKKPMSNHKESLEVMRVVSRL